MVFLAVALALATFAAFADLALASFATFIAVAVVSVVVIEGPPLVVLAV